MNDSTGCEVLATCPNENVGWEACGEVEQDTPCQDDMTKTMTNDVQEHLPWSGGPQWQRLVAVKEAVLLCSLSNLTLYRPDAAERGKSFPSTEVLVQISDAWPS